MPNSKTDLAVIKQATGASLIEVLVALIIFSIGVLGVTGLQLSAANNSQINNHFIQAQLITDNLSSRIKLNKSAVLTTQSSATQSLGTESLSTQSEYFTAQSYDLSLYGSCQSSYYQCFCQQAPALIPTCRVTSCSPVQLAQFDTYEVACMLALMSNAAAIHIYPKAINTDTLLLSINLIWPTQNLSQPSFSLASSDCLQAIQDVGDSDNTFSCYSQLLVITATDHDS